MLEIVPAEEAPAKPSVSRRLVDAFRAEVDKLLARTPAEGFGADSAQAA